jgi:hypothetical protein
MKCSPLIVELLEFILISSCNFFELLFTSIYYLNTNVNSWRVPYRITFLYKDLKIWSNQLLTGQKYFPTKIFPFLFHIKPFIFKTFSWSYSLSDFQEIVSIKLTVELFEFILISSCNFFELLFTSIYYLNTNVNSCRHNFIC